MNGGYYTYDIDDKLTVIGINSIYFAQRNYWYNGEMKNQTEHPHFGLENIADT